MGIDAILGIFGLGATLHKGLEKQVLLGGCEVLN